MNRARLLLTSSVLSAATVATLLATTSNAHAAGPAAAPGAPPTKEECLSAADKSIQLREQHHLREARAQMLVCAQPSCPAAIQGECMHRVEQVNGAIPTVVFEAKDGAGNDLSNVSVAMDGQPLTDRLDGSALPLDPGEHHFRFTAPGGVVVDKTVVIHEGEKDRHEPVVVGPVAAPGGAQPAGGGQPAPGGATTPLPGSDENKGSSQRTIAYAVGGAGVVGIVVGAIFGGLASSAASSSKNECSTSTCGAANFTKATNDYNSASTDGTVSTVAFIVGGAALATGAVLFFTAPSAASASPTTGSRTVWQLSPAVGTSGFGLSLKGAL